MSDSKQTTHELCAEHARAFDQVIEMYRDIASTDGGSTTPKGITKWSRVVAPSTCDFLCDVELTTNRAVISEQDKMLMNLLVWNPEVKGLPEDHIEDMARIKDRVGHLFISRKIYPTQQYFKGKAIN